MMRKTYHIGIILLVLILQPALLWGQQHEKRALRVRTEWAASVGAGAWSFSSKGSSEVKARMGWQAGISMALIWDTWALQPEIRYVRHKLEITPWSEADPIDLKSSEVEVPLLVSWRPLASLRIAAGPVLTLLNSCKYNTPDGLQMDVGRVRPTLGYTLGLGWQPGRRVLFDLRYVGSFGSVGNIYWENGPEIEMQGHAVQLSIGILLK